MPNRDELHKLIKERMKDLKRSEVCALFLLAVTRKGKSGLDEDFNLEQTSERVSALLSRLFHQTNLVGYLGGNRFVAFMSGQLSGSVIWERASVLSQALWLTSEDLPSWHLSSYVGVYMFDSREDDALLLRRAEYALEMAYKNEERHFYIHTSADLEAEGFPLTDLAVPVRTLNNYLDEGVRILSSGEERKVLYTSPGFYKRLFLFGAEAVPERVKLHPLDQENHEKNIRKALEEEGEVESWYRVSGDGLGWIPCRVQLQRVETGTEPVVLEISHNITGLVQLKNQSELDREWLHFLSDQSSDLMWEVDIPTRTFRLLYTQRTPLDRPVVYENFPESMIESGRVHRDSAGRFRQFAQDMMMGKMNGSDKFIVQHGRTGCYGWASLSYHMLYDKDGHPEKAIGLKEDLAYLPTRRLEGLQRRNVPSDLFPNLFCFVQANLTKDLVERLLIDGRERSGRLTDSSYTGLLNENMKRLFPTAEMKRFKKLFNRETMLESYSQGRRWFYELCKVVNYEGAIWNVAAAMNVNRDPESGDVYAFGYISRRAQRVSWEQKLNFAPRMEPETGVYQPETAKNMCLELLGRKRSAPCAMVEIRAEGVKELFGAQENAPARRDLVTALNVFLDTNCVIFRNSPNSLLAFFPEAPSKGRLKRKLEEAFVSVRISMEEDPRLRLVRLIAGIIYRREDEEARFEEMAALAGRICTIHSGEAEDTVCFGEDVSELSSGGPDINEPAKFVKCQVPDGERAMNDEEQKAALASLGLMLQAENRDVSVNSVLRTIGEYYHADRVYILILTQKCQIVTMLNEWVGKGKVSIQQAISGKRTDQFPVLAHYLRNPVPVRLAMRNGEGDERKLPWQYSIYPMESTDDARQLLCVENPRLHRGRSALLHFLIPYLSGERKRFMAKREGASALDRLYELPNLKAYQDVIYSINSDMYTSLGVMAVDIPDFALVKEQQGYEYGSHFLVKISEVLRDVFGAALLFRTREAEFIALCLNMTYEAFFNRCNRVQQLIGRKYVGRFRIGLSWSNQVFKGDDQVKKARSIMRCAGSPESMTGEVQAVKAGTENGLKVGTDQFTIYLQPKIDMRTGKLAGAEALVRVMDEKGGILPHLRVIEAMEQEGTIQEMDYFVFDKTLQTMSQWKEKGYELPRISSNFSRITLLNPSALASVLAISSRYPEVPQNLVEMEITETAGDFENNTFAELIERFGGYGFQFSLDDFGSSYSNISMLTNLHFRSIKLDRSMIRNISENSMTRMLVRDIVKLCNSSGMVCIAEGVENQEQEKALLENGCVYAQGYYYDRPMPLREFEQKYLQA